MLFPPSELGHLTTLNIFFNISSISRNTINTYIFTNVTCEVQKERHGAHTIKLTSLFGYVCFALLFDAHWSLSAQDSTGATGRPHAAASASLAMGTRRATRPLQYTIYTILPVLHCTVFFLNEGMTGPVKRVSRREDWEFRVVHNAVKIVQGG